MAGLDPATQRAEGAKKDSRGDAEDAEKKKTSASSASPRETYESSFRSLTLASLVAGSGPAMVIKEITRKYRDMTRMRGGYAVPSFFLRTK